MNYRVIAALSLCVLGCTDSATSLRLKLAYEDSWGLSALALAAGAETVEGLEVKRELSVLVPDAWAGTTVIMDVVGLEDGTPFAEGRIETTPVFQQEVSYDLALEQICSPNLAVDVHHCGNCTNDCTLLPGIDVSKVTCSNAACSVSGGCSAGKADCTGEPGCETDITAASHCGACTTNCSGATPLCAPSGSDYGCVATCPPAAPDLCGSTCVNKKTDVRHCGSCTADCSELPGVDGSKVSCGNGACSLAGACLPNKGDCTAVPGCETDLTTGAHCGSCTTACSGATPACALSSSTYSCASGCSGQAPDLCGSTCVNQQSDKYHCGDCATDCTELPGVNANNVTCVSGACNLVGACLPNNGDCTSDPGCETDLTTAAQCGNCGISCSGSTPACTSNGVSYSCTNGCSGQTPDLCGTTCVNKQTNPNHCSSCDPCPHPAHSTATCTGGSCGLTCAANYHNCSGACLSDNSINSCNASCTSCTPPANSTATCDGISCDFTCTPPYWRSGGGCVNSETCGPYVIANGGTTVQDTGNSLTWQQGDSMGDGTGGLAWSAAGSYCTHLTLAGGGWRLPTKNELLALLLTAPENGGCYINRCAFSDSCDFYWSSTRGAGSTESSHWGVQFAFGHAGDVTDTSSNVRVRCVR